MTKRRVSYPQHDCSTEKGSKLSLTQQMAGHWIHFHRFLVSLAYKLDLSAARVKPSRKAVKIYILA